jgi:MoxR-like ATPase
MLISIFAGHHALLEGYPGLGKTMMVKTLARTLGLNFGRIQCTPDLMPSDITGTHIIEEDPVTRRKSFKFQKGPLFTHMLLADEINRATPKTQSALLEAMQEKQITVAGQTFPLEPPFFVLATQNPIEMEGTFPLPEAQLDRFLLKINVKYPTKIEEARIVERFTSPKLENVQQILDRLRVLGLQKLTLDVPVASEVRDYAVTLANATRPANGGVAKQYLEYGVSTRAAIYLVLAAKARALINGRNYVSKDDIRVLAYPVLRHRLIPSFEAERQGITIDTIITEILKEVGK